MATPSVRAVPGNSITLSSARPAARRLAAGLVAAAVASLAAAGPQFTSGVNVVEVYATVTDARGEPVTGLTRADFVVRENGQAQEISTFAAGEFPLSVALALDRSFSMGGERLALAKSGARVFLGELRPEDKSMLIAVGSQVEIVAPLSADRAAQFEVVSRLDAFGTTGLYDSIVTAIDAIQQASGRRVLVLLSDGADRYSTATADEAIQHARRSDVLVYPVALGRERPPVFAELATLTGGRSSYLREPKALAETLRGIARELRHQYLIGYSPSRPIVAGRNEWRAIDVRVSRADVQVRARDGYLIK
jgi:Ca-activated chloride channel family protein